jgi:hypothetical protein
MPKKNKYPFRSIKTRPPVNSSLLKQDTLTVFPSCKLYRHISSIPLDIFIDIFCDKNVELLIIQGQTTQGELEKAWEGIYDDFIEKMQDDDGRAMQDQIRDMNLLRTKINTVATIIDYIRWLLGAQIRVDLDDILAELTEWTGLPVQLDQGDKTACHRTLDMVLAHVMTWKVEGEQMRQEMERSTADQDGMSKMDRDYFDSVIVALSIANKFKVNRKETMTGEFVVMVQALRRQIAEAKEFSKN